MLYCARLTIGGSFWFVVVRHREVQHLGVAVEAAPAGPGQAVAQEAVERAEALDDLQAAPRDADGAAAEADRVVGLDSTTGTPWLARPRAAQ